MRAECTEIDIFVYSKNMNKHNRNKDIMRNYCAGISRINDYSTERGGLGGWRGLQLTIAKNRMLSENLQFSQITRNVCFSDGIRIPDILHQGHTKELDIPKNCCIFVGKGGDIHRSQGKGAAMKRVTAEEAC